MRVRPGAGDATGWTRLARGRVRLTRRAGLHLALGLLLYGAGINVGAGWVLALASVVLGVVPWAWVTARHAAGRVEVRRALPPQPTAGVAVEIGLDVRAPTAAAVVVRDHLTGTVGVAGDPRDGAELTARTPLRRGVLTGGRVEATVTDLFGLSRATAAGQVASVAEVLPPVPTVARVALLARRDGGGEEAAGRGGPGPEVVGVREYTRGDPVRAIHWRTSARRGEVIVRDLAVAARPQLRVTIAAGTWTAPALDVATAAAAGVAAAAGAAGQSVLVAADGAVLPWGQAARRRLAALPPHAGAGPRPLAAAPPAQLLEFTLAPAPAGVVVSLARDRASEVLGVLPDDDSVEPGDWLTARLAGRG